MSLIWFFQRLTAIDKWKIKASIHTEFGRHHAKRLSRLRGKAFARFCAAAILEGLVWLHLAMVFA